ncbi:MAG: KdsC family phosphatase [Solirubrobacteraceae bacterium]
MINYKQKLKNITTFILDVDGVLTNSNVILMPDGSLTRTMNVRDGYALKLAIDQGYKIFVITGGKDKQVKERLNLLGVQYIYLGISNKQDVYEEILLTYDLKKEEVLYMGDDMPDLEVLKNVGLGTCPSDAIQEIREIVDYISPISGGMGCVRDVIEQVLKVKNNWYFKDSKITSSI